MIEILLLLSFVFLIYIFFYKQYNKEYSLNQLEFSNMDKLNELLYEKNPIVLRSTPPINSVLPQTLLKTPRFAKVLGDYLEKKDTTLPLSDQFESFLADETGFHSFGMHAWYTRFHNSIISEYITSLKSKLCFGSKNLQKTYGLFNIIIPIEGRYICSIMNGEYEKSLPSLWKNINTIDTIISKDKQIQYMDIILKPGSILILPAHWFYIMNEESTYSYYGILEYHDPASILSEYLEKKHKR
jgi:hypothetical protein